MKKLIVAAMALGLAVSTVPALIGVAQAAPAKSPFCSLAAGQRNLVGWNAYYHCLGTEPQPSRVAARRYAEPAKSPFCKLANQERNLVGWNAYYHCL
jgi:hypothetical protein